MTRLAMWGSLVVGLLASCSQSSFRVGEGIVCSTDGDDDPYFTCDVGLGDLICINTYKVRETPAWVCRRACVAAEECRRACVAAEECPQSDDVCCAGPIEGRDFGKERACVPRGLCQTGNFLERMSTPTAPRPDGSVRDSSFSDTAVVEDAAADMSVEPTPDASMSLDAPETTGASDAAAD